MTATGTMTTATARTEPQRLRALERANAVRLARAELKRRIADGDVSAAEIILQCPDAARKWTVSELLVAQRRWGSTRCRKFLERNGVSEVKVIGTLTDRQRQLLARQLPNGPAGSSVTAESAASTGSGAPSVPGVPHVPSAPRVPSAARMPGSRAPSQSRDGALEHELVYV